MNGELRGTLTSPTATVWVSDYEAECAEWEERRRRMAADTRHQSGLVQQKRASDGRQYARKHKQENCTYKRTRARRRVK